MVLQDDGNLVLYNKQKEALWASNTNNIAIEKCIMQNDGNPAWASKTNGSDASYLIIQNDGNIVLYSDNSKAIWSSNTFQN